MVIVLTKPVSYAKLTIELDKTNLCCVEKVITMSLRDAMVGQEYIVRKILTNDEETDAFLFSLGCYTGEPITVISHLRGSSIVAIKDARYSIDKNLAQAILI